MIVCDMLMFTLKIICLCEAINYLQKKDYGKKLTLLNLGNTYTRPSGILLFVILHLSFLVLPAGIFGHIEYYVEVLGGRWDQYIIPAYTKFYRVYGLFHLLFQLAAILFFAWYHRKFLLEAFINFNVRSRFVYWLAMIPVIGLIAFVIAIAVGRQNNTYKRKLESLEQLGSSRVGAVTAIILAILGIRLIANLVQGSSAAIIADLVSFILVIWMMSSVIGYWVLLTLNIALVLLTCTAPFYLDPGSDIQLGIMLPYGLLGIVQAVLILPVYHFTQFEYIPAEDPLFEKPENVHLP